MDIATVGYNGAMVQPLLDVEMDSGSEATLGWV